MASSVYKPIHNISNVKYTYIYIYIQNILTYISIIGAYIHTYIHFHNRCIHTYIHTYIHFHNRCIHTYILTYIHFHNRCIHTYIHTFGTCETSNSVQVSAMPYLPVPAEIFLMAAWFNTYGEYQPPVSISVQLLQHINVSK